VVRARLREDVGTGPTEIARLADPSLAESIGHVSLERASEGDYVRAWAKQGLLVGVLGVAAGLAACGSSEDSHALDPSDPNGNVGADGGGPVSVVQGDRPALRRLTHEEYRRTVTDLFVGTDVGIDALTAAFPSEDNFDGFSNDSRSLSISPTHFEQYLLAAEGVAAKVAVSAPAIFGCNPLEGDGAACVRGFASSFGKKAFRRPLSQEEIDSLVGVFTKVKGEVDATNAVEAVVSSILVSPKFLYRSEMGIEGAPELTQYEIASRLSYLLLGSLPDDALFKAADENKLGAPADRISEATRLLTDPRARAASVSFYDEWLSLKAIAAADKDTDLYKEFTPALRTAMRDETRGFIDDVLWNNDGRLETLLLAPYSIVPPALATFYGAKIPAKGPAIRVDFDPTQRAGILTQPSVLSIQAGSQQSSPTFRGKFVRERMLCETLPPAPAAVSPDVPGPNNASTTRQRYAQHQTDPSCSGCHQLMDPIGYGLENFDAIGKFRLKEGTFDIDATGTIAGGGDANGDFNGFRALGQKLVASKTVSDCVTRQMFQYSFGRAPDSNDTTILSSASTRFVSSNKNLKEILLAFIESDSFAKR